MVNDGAIPRTERPLRRVEHGARLCDCATRTARQNPEGWNETLVAEKVAAALDAQKQTLESTAANEYAEVARAMDAVTEERNLAQRQLADLLDNHQSAQEEISRQARRADVAELELNRLRTEHEKANQFHDDQLRGIGLELTAIRTNSSSVAGDLAGLSQEILQYRDENTSVLKKSSEDLATLAQRVHEIRRTLTGELPPRENSSEERSNHSSTQQTTGAWAGVRSRAENRQNSSASDTNDLRGSTPALSQARPVTAAVDPGRLLLLPQMTPNLVSQLEEMGVTSLNHIANWSSEAVAQYQNLLAESPNVITDNRWVANANALLKGESMIFGVGSSGEHLSGDFVDETDFRLTAH